MSVVSRSQKEILEDIKKLILQKNELLETLKILATKVSRELLECDEKEVPAWEESEAGIISYIETREPFLEKINDVDSTIRELVMAGNRSGKTLEASFPVMWDELIKIEHTCKVMTDEILTIDEKLLPLIEMAFSETKDELKKTNTSKKAFNAYGKNAGKI